MASNEDLLQLLQSFFKIHGTRRTYWIAFSGGLDSTVLLTLCHAIWQTIPLSLKVIHIDHSVHPQSHVWAKTCRLMCQSLQLPCLVEKVTMTPKTNESLEAVLRQARYAIFQSLIHQGDMLLTAHHANDQAETLLLQLFRGCGPKGLSSMPIVKSLGQGFLGRPLLSVERRVLAQYARVHQLTWIEDESNYNMQWMRNYIRHDVMPYLQRRIPALTQILSRTASHCAESQILLEEFSSTMLKDLSDSKDKTLSISRLLTLNERLQRLALRTWIHHLGFPLPDTKKLNRILDTVLLAKKDRMPHVSWGKCVIRRFRDDLYLLPHPPTHHRLCQVNWDCRVPLLLEGIGLLSVQSHLGKGLREEIDRVTVRFRQGGERLALHSKQRQTLKNLFQAWQVPTWERDRIPLLFKDDECIGVVGYAIAQPYKALPNEVGCEPVIEKAIPA